MHRQLNAEGDRSDTTSLAEKVATHYVLQAHTRFQDTIVACQELLNSVNAFLADPSEQTHMAAKQAWIKAHENYSHCEVFRFGNPNVDAWEGKVNAWPMDEGLIDYVADGYIFHEGNPFARKNIVAKGVLPITDELIAEFQSGADPKAAPLSSITDIESNVTTGFHAVEFLLWGQDLNRNPTESGQRPFTDFVVGERGTGGSQKRRRDYLSAATRLIISDLRLMTIDWDPGKGIYTSVFNRLPVEQRLDRILLGLGSLGFAEVATERMRVAMITNDQEEEQSCFSDTTHRSNYHNILAIRSLYVGNQRARPVTDSASSVSLSALVRKYDPALDKEILLRMDKSIAQAKRILDIGEQGQHFDQLILPENEEGRDMIRELIQRLKLQTESLEKAATVTQALSKF